MKCGVKRSVWYGKDSWPWVDRHFPDGMRLGKGTAHSHVFQKLIRDYGLCVRNHRLLPVAAMPMWEGVQKVMKQRPAHIESLGCCAKGPSSFLQEDEVLRQKIT